LHLDPVWHRHLAFSRFIEAGGTAGMPWIRAVGSAPARCSPVRYVVGSSGLACLPEDLVSPPVDPGHGRRVPAGTTGGQAHASRRSAHTCARRFP
jgi:hypothetical protein